MRSWDISIYLVGPDGDDIPASCYEKATYVLHESFGPKRMRQTFKQLPFKILEKGWGEFDMNIVLTPVGAPKGGDQTIQHDLNFQQERYESTHVVTFRNPKPDLLAALRESGPTGDASNGAMAGSSSAAKEKKQRKGTGKTVDMEKLAEALPQLGEDDLLQVVQMVHDNKTEETYTKNDIESESGSHATRSVVANRHIDGEFHVDLYTLPDPLIKMLWDFTSARVDMAAVA